MDAGVVEGLNQLAAILTQQWRRASKGSDRKFLQLKQIELGGGILKRHVESEAYHMMGAATTCDMPHSPHEAFWEP